MIPDPREKPTLSITEAAELLGISKSKAYDEVQRFKATGRGIPVLDLTRTMRVPTAKLLAMLDLESEEPAPSSTGPSLLSTRNDSLDTPKGLSDDSSAILRSVGAGNDKSAEVLDEIGVAQQFDGEILPTDEVTFARNWNRTVRGDVDA